MTPKDSDGNVVEPFISEGTTYLPVQAVADALGQPVEWDGKTSTVYIGRKADGISLTSLPYARSKGTLYVDGWSGGTPYTVASKSYSTGFGFYNLYWDSSTYDYEIVYNLDSLYKSLSGIFGVDDAGKQIGKATSSLVIQADGKEIYRSGDVSPGDIKNVSIDVTNVNQIKFMIHAYDSCPVFVNPILK